MKEKAKTIKDYMIPLSDYPHVNDNTTLHEAVNIIHRMSKEKGYRWLVVMNDNNNIAGFLTLRNIFEAISKLAPRAGGLLGIFSTVSRPDFFFLEGIQLIKDTPIKKCIKPMVQVSVHENDSPGKVAEIILSHRITITPVVNSQNEVVGVVRPIDLIPFIKKLFDNAPPK
ncbi:CBS domain-containing protein [Desulfoscipio geothermicus]|uniref:CBS domain-containing protein n=1 Tax=Desulfoscipio geothermicus DSM 3669 TaxID=1121426 RepID=A0A1I6DSN0_9FIRM|nr:CBS domain-containing protein [Desulfoscipio geothermicus]SFR08361.1 CBS domain-containing protein [Desulfoscipio geothermicus DSM 3669]